jgi:hypothetical protein
MLKTLSVSHRLSELGFQLELAGIGQQGRIGTVAFHRNPHGNLWIELLERAVWEELHPWISQAEEA